MLNDKIKIALVFSGLVLALASPAWAQDPAPEKDAEKPEVAKEGEQPAKEGEEASKDGEAAKEGEVKPEDAVKAEGEPVAQPPAAGAAPEAGGKVGPGGKPLREDYPGTEESLKERMETDRLKGIAEGNVSSKEVYDMRVRELETRIDDLKDKVFRSKSRIVLLRETVLGNRVAGSKARIAHKDELGDQFKLRRITYMLDNNPLRMESDEGGNLSERGDFDVFDGAIGPGTHDLVVQLEYQGSNLVFGYFEGYTVSLSERCQFTVDEGMATTLNVIVFKKDDVTLPVEKKPTLRCETKKVELKPETAAPPKKEAPEAKK